MFSSNIHLLPSLYYYENVVEWYKDTQPHRRSGWKPYERGLDGPRKHHYRIVHDGEETYAIWLYDTPIVIWQGPNKAVVDVSSGTNTTQQFAYRYTRAFGTVASFSGQASFVVDGIKWAAEHNKPFVFELREMPPGASKHSRKYKLTSVHNKIWRKVLDPDQAHEYRQASKEFKRWARGIWALSGNDGSHPWENEKKLNLTAPQIVVEGRDISNKDNWEEIVKAGILLSQKSFGWGSVYGKQDIEKILRAIDREHQRKMYVKIDYDAPLPKRSK